MISVEIAVAMVTVAPAFLLTGLQLHHDVRNFSVSFCLHYIKNLLIGRSKTFMVASGFIAVTCCLLSERETCTDLYILNPCIMSLNELSENTVIQVVSEPTPPRG